MKSQISFSRICKWSNIYKFIVSDLLQIRFCRRAGFAFCMCDRYISISSLLNSRLVGELKLHGISLADKRTALNLLRLFCFVWLITWVDQQLTMTPPLCGHTARQYPCVMGLVVQFIGELAHLWPPELPPRIFFCSFFVNSCVNLSEPSCFNFSFIIENLNVRK